MLIEINTNNYFYFFLFCKNYFCKNKKKTKSKTADQFETPCSKDHQHLQDSETRVMILDTGNFKIQQAATYLLEFNNVHFNLT